MASEDGFGSGYVYHASGESVFHFLLAFGWFPSDSVDAVVDKQEVEFLSFGHLHLSSFCG